MAALLSRALAAQPSCPILPDIRERAAAFTMRSLRMAGELARILNAMRAAGVPAIAFKGPVLAYAAYGDLALRAFNDLDIFVPRAQLPAALNLLAADGFDKKTGAWDIRFSGACEIALQHRLSRCEVDLHWLFSPPYFLPFDPAAAVQRSVEFRLGGLAGRTLCPEDHLLYLCIHAAREGWGQAQFPCDVAGLAARCPIDWDGLVRRAERTQCWRALAAGLDLAHRLCDAPLPPEVLRRVQRDPAALAVSASALAALAAQAADPGGTPAGAMLHLRTIEGLRAKVRYLWRRALQPNQKDAAWVPLPRHLWAAYYVIRPVRLASSALGRLKSRTARLLTA